MMTGERQLFVGFHTMGKTKQWLEEQAAAEGLSVSAYCHNHFIDLSGGDDADKVSSKNSLDLHGRS